MIKSVLEFGKGNKYDCNIIRFRRRGHKHLAFYDIVVINKKARSVGPYIDKLGYFSPVATDRSLVIDSGRLAFWVNRGAKVHSTVKKYLVKFLVNGIYDSK